MRNHIYDIDVHILQIRLQLYACSWLVFTSHMSCDQAIHVHAELCMLFGAGKRACISLLYALFHLFKIV